jgi:hypothetical protein
MDIVFLKRFPIARGKWRIELDDAEMRVFVPAFRNGLVVPRKEVMACCELGDKPDLVDVVLSRKADVHFVKTRGQTTSPDLAIVFSTRQQMPKLRLGWRIELGLSRRSLRDGTAGIDGISLSPRTASEAASQLVAWGVPLHGLRTALAGVLGSSPLATLSVDEQHGLAKLGRMESASRLAWMLALPALVAARFLLRAKDWSVAQAAVSVVAGLLIVTGMSASSIAKRLSKRTYPGRSARSSAEQ